MTNIAGSPAEPAAKMNRQQRRQAARQATRQARKKPLVGNLLESQPQDSDNNRDLDTAYRAHLANDLQVAAKFYQRVLARQPNHPKALLFLGVLAHQTGKSESAIALISRALRLIPNDAFAHYNLGTALKQLGRLEEAIAACRRALQADPHSAEAYNALGFIFQAGGRFDEAEAAFESALAIKPHYATPYKGLTVGRKVRREDHLIQRIETILCQENTPKRDRSILNFALGQCFNDIEEYDQAFLCYRTANNLSGKDQDFDPVALTKRTDRLIATFTQEFFDDRGTLGSDSEQPIFIVGMPRSGTSLVEQIVASHPKVFGAGELLNFNQMTEDLCATLKSSTPYPECSGLIDESAALQLAAGYLADLDKLSRCASRVTDKMPNNFRNLGLIALLFPRARILHCRRDPLDICLSCYFLDFTGHQPFAYDLTHLGQYYGEYERLMAHWKDVLPIQILDVQYEELVANKEQISQEMISFCGLDWDDACLAHDETERPVMTASHWQARQPIYKTSVDRWRRYETHLGPLKAALGDAC